MSLAAAALAASKRTPDPKPLTMAEQVRAVRDPYSIAPSDLQGIVGWRVSKHPVSRSLSGYETEALTAVVVARVSGSRWQRHGRPADVLRWIDWAPTHQATAERAERIPRGEIGHAYIDKTIDNVARESREWRDTCDTYRVRARRDRETVREQEVSVLAHDFEDSDPGSDETPSATQLAVEARWIDSQSERAPMSLDADELAASLAGRIGHTETERRAVYAAILRVTAEDPAVALDLLARGTGRALKSVRNDATDGLRLIAAMNRDELREAIMECTTRRDNVTLESDLPRKREGQSPRPQRPGAWVTYSDESALDADSNRMVRRMVAAIDECWHSLTHGARRTGKLAPTAERAQRRNRPGLTYPQLDLLAAAREVLRDERRAGAWNPDHVPAQAIRELGVPYDAPQPAPAHPAATPHPVEGHRHIRRPVDEQRRQAIARHGAPIPPEYQLRVPPNESGRVETGWAAILTRADGDRCKVGGNQVVPVR